MFNPDPSFETVEYAYRICTCSGQDKYAALIKKRIEDGKIYKISKYRWKGIEWGQDSFGVIPVGSIIDTYLIKLKSGQIFIQLIKRHSEVERPYENSIYYARIPNNNIERFYKRELI